MQIAKYLSPLFLLVLCWGFVGLNKKETSHPFKSKNSLIFGGVVVTVDVTDCSLDNSSDGKSRAIAAVNSEAMSMCVVQFGVVDPASGTYTTILEEPIDTGQVILGGGGSALDGAFVAVSGQSITITHESGKYRAVFNDIALMDPITKGAMTKKVTGNFGCD